MIDKIKRFDWFILLLLVLFLVSSCFLVYSATVSVEKFGPDFWKRIPVNAAVGFSVFFIVSFIDFRFLIKMAPYMYVVGIGLLAALFVWGTEREGAKSWFTLPFIGDFQPAELMKVLLIIAIAAYAARRKGERLLFWRDIVPIGIITLIPFILVLVQPDLGNAMIFVVILLGMYWISNIKYTHVLIGLLALTAFLGSFFYLFNNHREIIDEYATEYGFTHMVRRIDTFLDPDSAHPNASYQYFRSKIAIGSGRLTGDGYLQGNSIHNQFVPVAYTDGIFVVVAEEFGFIGSSALMMLYFILIYRLILISIQSTNLAGSYLIVGIVSMYVFQIFQNIGMFLGLMPITGITLPFISYGGTSLLINMLSLGIVMSVKLHRDKDYMFGEDE